MKHANSIFATEVDRCKIAARMHGSDAATPGPGSTPALVPADATDLRRIAVHESGHCLVARLLDRPVHSVTVVPSPERGFAGCAMIGEGSPVYRTIGESVAVVDSICSVVDQHAPRPGESREDLEAWLRSAHENVVELLAGAAAEVLVFGSVYDKGAASDYRKAQRYARTITASDASAEAFLKFALTEACETIRPYVAVLHALADTLIEQRELDSVAIDRTIATALVGVDRDRELARQADWAGVIQRAAAFPGDPAQ